RLEDLRLAAHEGRLEAELALGLHAQAVPELEALVREHPLRESLCRLLMLALYRGGRQADALAVYQEARRTLVDELGLEPGQALQQLEKAILVQDPGLDPPRPPAPPSPRDESSRERVAARSRCDRCGAANEQSARFCHACGAELAVELAIELRKTVTVLFCDVVASTGLGERLDPESLRRLMSRYFEEASAVLDRHGGTVEKFIGDEVMAVFGVPAVRQDDALRAVRAAAELRERLSALSVPEWDTRLQVRIGVNTGEVVAGDPSGGHAFVTGDAVVVGKRLEQAAQPGEVLLGEETYALVAHAVAAEPLGPLPAKNKPGGVAAYRLDRVDPDPQPFPPRQDVPLVGRDAALQRLLGRYGLAASGGVQLATVVGQAGIGKSRLARELAARVGGEAAVLVGRCRPYGEGSTFWPLRELLTQAGGGSSPSSRTSTGPSRRCSTSSSTSPPASATPASCCSASHAPSWRNAGRSGCATRSCWSRCRRRSRRRCSRSWARPRRCAHRSRGRPRATRSSSSSSPRRPASAATRWSCPRPFAASSPSGSTASAARSARCSSAPRSRAASSRSTGSSTSPRRACATAPRRVCSRSRARSWSSPIRAPPARRASASATH
ncbi:MAG TPA: BTAD domain-containing putative transcriptional regulator, partial [Gaiellaceae bacterium]|nr:BTAD domain-containing putative transcriptional regulator [Gaiellaceae bacterium]